MNTGKTAQLMDFDGLLSRGSRPVWRRSPGPCAEQYRSMAFAQLIPGKPARHRTCLSPRIETLSHGLPPAGPALDAGRCQRKARLAYPCGVGPAELITQATLYVDEELGLDTDQTVYALDSTNRSVPVGLSVGALPHHQGGGESTRCSTCGATFRVLSTGWTRNVHALDNALAGSRSHLRRGS